MLYIEVALLETEDSFSGRNHGVLEMLWFKGDEVWQVGLDCKQGQVVWGAWGKQEKLTHGVIGHRGKARSWEIANAKEVLAIFVVIHS